MNRETTNVIRTIIEDVLPPFLRDSFLFRGLASAVWGRHITHLAEFRRRAPFLSPQEYEALYKEHPRVHEGTDNSRACLDRIAADVTGESVLDVGCGTGALLRHVKANARAPLRALTGLEFVAPPASGDGITYVEGMVEALPFPDKSVDTVVCTHVVEHILDYRAAIKELRRVAAKRLIIVVPREREGLYTFNPHFNFWPYTHSFLRAMIPVPARHVCEDIGRDIYYREDLGD
jgi:SAM-dependent methyltransferase